MQQKFTHCYARRSLMALLWLLLPCIYLHAQKSVQPGRNVTITNSHISLRDVFNVIEKQTGVVLFFGDLNTSQLVGVKFVATPVEEALAEMLPPLGLTYEYVKGNKDKIFIRSIVADRKKDTVMVMSVSGVVTDDKGEPLPGANVRLKGTVLGTATKSNGSFTLNRTSENDILQISYMGFVMVEMPLGGKSNVKVQLKQSDNSLSETVVTAYGTTRQRAITGAITTVKGVDIQNIPNRSFDKSLQGLVPGLLVTQGSGQPGGGLSNFVIRGIATGTDATFGSTVRNPLIILDGIPINQDYFQITTSQFNTSLTNPLAQINTSDIESITVLKDASAIALYGAKASNGVILVTTKTGKQGQEFITIRNQTNFSNRINKKIHVLNQAEYLELLYESYRNFDPIKFWNDASIFNDLTKSSGLGSYKFPTIISNNGDTMFYAQPDWSSELYKSNAITTTSEVSFSSANEKSRQYLSLEYTNQDGIVRGTGYDRMSARVNIENSLRDNLKVGTNTTISYNKQDVKNIFELPSSYGIGNIISPLSPIRLSNGQLVLEYPYGTLASPFFPDANPVAEAQMNINQSKSYRGVSKFYAQLDIFRYIKFQPNIGVNFMYSETKEKVDPRLPSGSLPSGVGEIQDYSLRRYNIISSNLLRFDRQLGDAHMLNVLLGQEAQINSDHGLLIRGQGLRSPYYDQVANTNSIVSYTGFETKETLLSYFGQINYSLRDRYYLSSSIRRDGSSKFGNDRRYGTYWSTGLGWEVTKEPFMAVVNPYINYLKIRGSIGEAGNSAAINAATRYDILNYSRYIGQFAVFPGVPSPGNPKIQWEQTFNSDLGLELSAFKDLMKVTVDFYRRKTSRLIYQSDLSPVTGYLNVLDNIGNMENKGVEVALGFKILANKEFTWTLNGNWSINKNKLIKQNKPLVANGNLINKENENFNSFYLVRWAGVDPNDGMPQWLDASGKLTKEYNLSNRVIVGKPQPDGYGGLTNTLSYKGLELNTFISYKYGFQVYDEMLAILLNDGTIPYINQSTKALNRWQRPGDYAMNPKRILNNQSQSSNPSTRYLYNGDYLRLESLSLSYLLSKDICSRLRCRSFRVSLQGYNLGLLTKSKYNDPDLSNIAGQFTFPYPTSRTFSFMVEATF